MKQAPIEEFLKYIEPGPLALLTTFDGKKKSTSSRHTRDEVRNTPWFHPNCRTIRPLIPVITDRFARHGSSNISIAVHSEGGGVLPHSFKNPFSRWGFSLTEEKRHASLIVVWIYDSTIDL